MVAELRVPTAPELLATWERGLADEAARPGLLLAAVGVDGGEALAVGRRNELLLKARALLFGGAADVVAGCGECGEELEAELSIPDIVVALGHSDSGPVAVRSRRYAVRLRLPTSADLVGLPADVDEAARELLARCVVDSTYADTAVSPDRLPAAVVAAIDHALAEADPGAVLGLALACPACGAEASLALDPVRLLWTELDSWAWRLLAEVHLLATTHGWSEADVLDMTPARRQAYLHLCGSGEGVG